MSCFCYSATIFSKNDYDSFVTHGLLRSVLPNLQTFRDIFALSLLLLLFYFTVVKENAQTLVNPFSIFEVCFMIHRQLEYMFPEHLFTAFNTYLISQNY